MFVGRPCNRSHADTVATTAATLRVVDSDTFDIVDDVRARLRIRLLGIDTHETKKPGFSVVI
jgi:micrococcal nuclease